jgi:hypothetical protein
VIRVHLFQASPTPGYNEVVEMASVPRVGDSISFDEDHGAMEVRSVIWLIHNDRYDVQVRFR